MKLIVFGASGRTGQYIVQYALEAGHEVTAFMRDKSKFSIQHPKLKIVQGDVYDQAVVKQAIRGQEALISALGTNKIDDEKSINLMSDAMKIFVEALKENEANRVLAVGGLGVLQADETTQLINKPDYPAMFKLVGIGHNRVYEVLNDSALNWTFVCCPDLIPAPRSGKYSTRKDYPPTGQGKINIGDVADFLVHEMTENKFLKTRVGITNVD